MKKGELFLILFNLAYIIGFAIYYLLQKNYEFMIYIAVLVVLFFVMIFLHKKFKFSYLILSMISIWGLLHMMGGGVHLGDGTVLYRWIPLEIYNAHDQLGEFVILKFDQILHFYIYFVMSFVLVHLLRGKINVKGFWFYAIIALMSMGLSIVNELIEFGAAIYVQDNGVGGYFNTSLDLLFNSIGAWIGALACYWRRK